MSYPWRIYPALTQKHVENAKLFAHRNDMVRSIAGSIRAETVTEIGVAFGDFSAILLDAFRPDRFVAFDLFTMHEWPSIWGKPPTDTFGSKTHIEFYRDRFSGLPVVTEPGRSGETLARYPDDYFDLIYIDGDHEYDGVLVDAELSKKKMKQDGILIFNDYIMYDHAGELPYGIVPVVNEIVVNQNWEVIGFALEQNMFCDIAIRRTPSSLT